MIKKTLLIEIGTEELPAKLLYELSLNFHDNFINELKFYNILYEKIHFFSTPRRLALKIIKLDTSEKIIKIEKKGPSIKDSFDKNGFLTEKAKKWMHNFSININQTDRLKHKKDEWLVFRTEKKQEKIQSLIPKMIKSAIKKISIKKTMRWDTNNQKFSRPIRNIVILLNSEVLKEKIFNVTSNNILQNHICFQEKKIEIQHAEEYPLILFKENHIIADYAIRKKNIIKSIKKIATYVNGFVKIKNLLINEVSSLVESPVAMLATFEKKFLIIPKEILMYTIEKQQKCFPLHNSKKEMLPYFIFISNIHSKEPRKIILGNEKVMNARLSDTEFFFNKDRRIKLEKYLPYLKKILFQDNLGSMYEKTLRIKLLIEWISHYSKSNTKNSMRAALLSKCDLVTDMVCEFPELQGTIGMYYALEDQEEKDISIALKEQYLPSFSGDTIPITPIGSSLSIADKMDTLSGMFLIGKSPNSDKDPFALRRLSIGLLRTIIYNNIPLDLKELINKSLLLHNKKIDDQNIYNKIMTFFITRLFNWYLENGFNIKVIKSVLSCNLTQPIEIHKKITSISEFIKLNDSTNIILSIKRITNILEKNNKKITGKFNFLLIKEIEEKQLFDEIKNIINQTKDLFIEKKYKEILLKIKTLESPIKDFFNKVKIHDTDSKIELNRLILLTQLEKFFLKIANFSYLY